MSERFKVHPWKGCAAEMLPGVRISLFPIAQMPFKCLPQNPARGGIQQRYAAGAVLGIIWAFFSTKFSEIPLYLKNENFIQRFMAFCRVCSGSD